ncbi:hypothetical protein RJT34_25017 [Clitoria ternatea]|uniref:Low-temperature-induced 65 kDa protein n=1 Tax=Clitoria ternatea TaxID=43366 RepID=A0AAN9IJP3_CLITE
MDSSVVQSEVHEKDEQYPNNVASQQVPQGAEENQFDIEKKSVLTKVKAKAKKIKDSIKKHGHQALDHGHENNNEDQHTPDDDDDDHDLDDDEEMAEEQEIHETPIHEREAVKIAAVTSEQDEIIGKSGNNVGGKTDVGEEPHHDPQVGGVSSPTDINQSIATGTDPAKTFSVEEKAGLPMDNLEKPIGLEEDPQALGRRPEPELYTPPNYQTKVTDPRVAGSDEIEITPVEESFARMNVQEEPKHAPEPNIQRNHVDSEFPPAASHDQFVPHFSAATQTQNPSAESQDQSFQGTVPTNISRISANPVETAQSFNTIRSTEEEQPHDEESTDKVVTPKDVIASEVGSDEKSDIKDKVTTNAEEQQKSTDAAKISGSSAAEEGQKNIAQSLTQKLTPVYEKVAGVGSAVKSKVSVTETKNGDKEQDKGVSVKDYLAEKLRPGEEDKALSEVISEALHKPKEVPVKNEHGHLGSEDEKPEKVTAEESSVNSQGKGVVDKLKEKVGSWFGKSEVNQSSQDSDYEAVVVIVTGGQDLSKNTNSGAEVEQVSQVLGGNSSPIEEQGTR